MYKNTAAYRCQTESFPSKLSLNKKKLRILSLWTACTKHLMLSEFLLALRLLYSRLSPFYDAVPLLTGSYREWAPHFKETPTQKTHKHTYTHAYIPLCKHDEGFQLQLACPFRCNLEGFCNIKQRYLTGRFMYSVSPV
jgi:hypothetical protein